MKFKMILFLASLAMSLPALAQTSEGREGGNGGGSLCQLRPQQCPPVPQPDYSKIKMHCEIFEYDANHTSPRDFSDILVPLNKVGSGQGVSVFGPFKIDADVLGAKGIRAKMYINNVFMGWGQGTVKIGNGSSVDLRYNTAAWGVMSAKSGLLIEEVSAQCMLESSGSQN